MGRQDDPYKLGWHFWSRYLLQSTLAATVGAALFDYFSDEPFTFSSVASTFLVIILMSLGPELSVHYYKPRHKK